MHTPKDNFMKKIIAYICICLASLTVARAQSAAVGGQETLPVDSAVLIGRLPNGITYYIRHNGDQPCRAGFYLIRNAGSLLETDEQNGLAHFLEHMAFQGTKHFPGKGIISGLEKHGVAFGSNINAYTSHNETVYQLTDVPTQSESLLDTC
ncbi:insulinase family protein, partial [Bacteroides acidifaciens]|uniref:M16 family metallopeptidase n=1 Tax=Bacteroides acidifaciens TaxID=85831 RepID=UPI0025B2AAC0